MEISKFKIVLKYLTGGVASVVEYFLDLFNEMIQKLPKDEVAKYAQLAKDVANFIKNICGVIIKDEKKKAAAMKTAEAFDALATSLLDAELSKDELDLIIEEVKAAIDCWKDA